MIPRYGETVRPNIAYRRRPGAYAILPSGDHLLLTVQFGEDTEIQLPGGGIDPGESPLLALHREVREETGWNIRIERRLGAFRRFTFMPEYDLWAEKVCHIYLGHPTIQISEPSESDHMTIFMTPEDAANQLGNPGDRKFLRKLIG